MINRRQFLGTAAASQVAMKAAEPLVKGQRFNEMQEFNDSITGHPSRRMTAGRRFNQTPTYTQNACFTADSRQMVLSTEDSAGNSAILKGDVETGDMLVVATSAEVKGTPLKANFNGNNMAINQKGNWVAAAVGGSVRLWDLKTLEQKIVYTIHEENVFLGHPIGSIDGKLMFFTVQKIDPSLKPSDSGTGRTLFLTYNGSPTDWMEADLTTGRVRVIHHEDRAGSNHLVANKLDHDFILTDRDWTMDVRQKTTRVWLLNRKTDKMIEIRPRDPYKFCYHSNFNGRGDLVDYHGPSSAGGQYFGAADLDGKVVWEYSIPSYQYGHLSTHPTWDALITDGMFTGDLVCAVFFKELDPTGAPRLQVLARHNTEWDVQYGQYSHPHCHVSPDGRWLTYNRGGAKSIKGDKPVAPGKGRTDVYIVRIG